MAEIDQVLVNLFVQAAEGHDAEHVHDLLRYIELVKLLQAVFVAVSFYSVPLS